METLRQFLENMDKIRCLSEEIKEVIIYAVKCWLRQKQKEYLNNVWVEKISVKSANIILCELLEELSIE